MTVNRIRSFHCGIKTVIVRLSITLSIFAIIQLTRVHGLVGIDWTYFFPAGVMRNVGSPSFMPAISENPFSMLSTSPWRRITSSTQSSKATNCWPRISAFSAWLMSLTCSSAFMDWSVSRQPGNGSMEFLSIRSQSPTRAQHAPSGDIFRKWLQAQVSKARASQLYRAYDGL